MLKVNAMVPKDTFEQAKFIYNAIKTIRHYFIRNAVKCCESKHRSSKLGGLSIQQFSAVNAIYEKGEATITELAKKLWVSPPSMSVMVDRLVEKGVVIRRQSKSDRRKVAVSLFPDVISEFQDLQEAILKEFVETVEKIGPEAAADWCSVLTRITSVLPDQFENGE